MATGGEIQIKISAEQALSIAKQLKQSLIDVDGAAKKVKGTVDTLDKSLSAVEKTGKGAADTTKQMASSMTQVAARSTDAYRELQKLNETARLMLVQQQQMNALLMQSSQAFRQQAQGAQAATASMQSTTQSARGLQNQLGATSSAAASLRNIMMTLGVGFTLAMAVQRLKEFDHSMAEVQSVLRLTGEGMDSLREKAKELGAQTIYTSSQAAEAMKYMAQSGFTTNEILTASANVLALAQAGNLGLAEASEIAAKALRGFRLEASQMGDVADIMSVATSQSTMNIQELGLAFKYVAPIAASLGVGMKETSAAIGVLSDAGIDASMAGTALRRVMGELQAPTKSSIRVLKAHGLALRDVDVSVRGLVPVLETLAAANLSVGESFTLFGQRGGPAFETLMQQVDKYKEKLANLDDVTGVALERQKVMAESLHAKFVAFTSALEFMFTQLSEKSGALNTVKAIFQGLHDVLVILGNNLWALTPVFVLLATRAVLAATSLSRMGLNAQIAATDALIAGTALKGLNIHLTGVAASSKLAAASLTLFGRALSFIGGPMGALMAIGTFFAYIASQTDAATEAGQKYSSVLEAQARGATATRNAIKDLRDQIQGMTRDQVQSEINKETDSLRRLKEQVTANIQSQKNLSEVTSEFGASVRSVQLEDAVENVDKLWKAYRSGNITIKDAIGQMKNIRKEYTDPAASEFIAKQMEIANSASVVERILSILGIRLNDIRIGYNRATEEARLYAEQQSKIRQGVPADYLGALPEMEAMAEIQQRLAKGTKVTQKVFSAAAGEMKSELFNALSLTVDKYNRLTVAVKNAQDAGDSWVVQTEEGTKVYAKSTVTSIQNMLQARINTELLNQARKDGVKDLKHYAKAIEDANKEVARMTMSAEAFAQEQFEVKIDKLQETLKHTNPELNKMEELMRRVKDAGAAAPKEIIKLRTEFEKFLKYGTLSKKDIELQDLEIHMKVLYEMYAGNEEKITKMKEFHAEERKKINRGARDKDIQAELQFWQEYMAITGRGQEEYRAALDKHLAEIRERYEALGLPIVAIEEKIQRERLKLSRESRDGIIRSYYDIIDEWTNTAKMTEQVTKSMFEGLADTIYEFTQKGKLDFTKMFNSIMQMITKMMIQWMIARAFMGITSAIGGMMGGGATAGVGGGLGTESARSNFGSMMNFGSGLKFADGAAFSGGRVIPFASGGVISSPTMFPMRGARGLMGEAGPEAVMPLTRMPSGQLGVQSTGANVTILVNIDNRAPDQVEVTTSQTTEEDSIPRMDIMIRAAENKIAQGIMAGTSPVGVALDRSRGTSRNKGLYK